MKSSYIIATLVIAIIVVGGLVGLWANGMLLFTSNNATPQPTDNPTSQPTPSPVETQAPTITPQPTNKPSQASTPTTPTTQPTITLTPTPTPSSTPTPSPTPTSTPTPTPTPTPTSSIAISYSLTTSSFYTWTGSTGTQYKENADTGKMFVQITLTAKNSGYASFNTNPNYFYLTSNNIKYTYDSGTYSVDTQTKWSTVDVLNGGTFTGTILYEVPNTATEFTIGYDRYLTPYNVVWTRT